MQQTMSETQMLVFEVSMMLASEMAGEPENEASVQLAHAKVQAYLGKNYPLVDASLWTARFDGTDYRMVPVT